MDREAWRAAIHGVTKSRTRLSDWTELKFQKNKKRSQQKKEKQVNPATYSAWTHRLLLQGKSE